LRKNVKKYWIARKAYHTWALQYDTNNNKTRDLEGQAFAGVLLAHHSI
jgi:hypothetical protein